MDERTAVVTGAAGTIGGGVVAQLLKQGRRVVLVDVDEHRLGDAVAPHPKDRVATVTGDVSVEALGARVNDAVAALGWRPVEILINNAGISPRSNGRVAGTLEVPVEEWNLTFAVNVTAMMLMARAFIPGMQASRWGRIVNVSSRAGRSNIGQSGPAYAASKAAVLGLTRSIACDFAADGITCNAVAPGLVDSIMTRALPRERFEALLAGTLVGRPGSASELGSACAYLASEDAGFITGACLDVNGGRSML